MADFVKVRINKQELAEQLGIAARLTAIVSADDEVLMFFGYDEWPDADVKSPATEVTLDELRRLTDADRR
jgi:hypothetical protein